MSGSKSPPSSRRGSSSRQGNMQQQQPPLRSSSSVSFGEGLRRQSTQERIEEILEVGRNRADNMGSSNPGFNSTMQPLSQSPIHEDGPNETTGMVMAQPQRNYQGTYSSTRSTRHRRPASTVEETTQQEEPEAEAETKDKSWLSEYLSGLWTIELENTGSVARDHLALERTFLAWLRTSLAFASIGIAVTQLFRLNTSLSNGKDDPHFETIRHIGKPLGATFIGISILVLMLGYLRYYQSQQWVMKGKFPASRGAVILISLIAFALMAVSLTVVIVVQPSVQSA